MTEDGPTEEPAPPSFRNSRATGEPAVALALGAHELKAEAAAHKRRLDLMRLEHAQAQDAQERRDRRRREMIGFYVVVGIALLGLTVGFAVAVEADNEDTRRWAQGLVTLLFGGIVGDLAGYFTGRVGK